MASAKERYQKSLKGRAAAARWNAKNPERLAFISAKSRCENPKDSDYESYGGRGIEFRFVSFEEFLAEIGRRPSKGHSLDRLNPWGHYEPGNVLWATKTQQELHKRGVIEELARIGPEGVAKLVAFLPKPGFFEVWESQHLLQEAA